MFPYEVRPAAGRNPERRRDPDARGRCEAVDLLVALVPRLLVDDGAAEEAHPRRQCSRNTARVPVVRRRGIHEPGIHGRLPESL